MDDAVRASVDKGIFYGVAAGNDGADACSTSPAGVGEYSGVMTTAATDIADNEAFFSNVGACVDIWSPGVSIESTSLRSGNTAKSGTSMAAPLTAGAAALYLSGNTTATPAQVEQAIKNAADSIQMVSKDGRPLIRTQTIGF